jgi:hypothetical protein
MTTLSICSMASPPGLISRSEKAGDKKRLGQLPTLAEASLQLPAAMG